MPQELVIKFILICSACALVGGLYNGFNYYHDRFYFEHISNMVGEERKQETAKLKKRAIIYGIQSWFWIIVLILVCFLATYPIFHKLK